MPGQLDAQSRCDLFARLGAMERAGLPAASAFAGLALPRRFTSRHKRLTHRLQQGWDIPRALRESGLLTPAELAMITVGHENGHLANIYARLHARLSARIARSRAVKARLMMPLAVLTIALVIQPLPALVSGAQTIGDVMLTLLQLIITFGLCLVLWHRLRHYASRRASAGRSRLIDRLLLRLPVVGPATLARAARDFSENLGDLLEAGLPMFDALPLARNVIGNRILADYAHQLEHAVRAGSTFAEASLIMPGEPFARLSQIASSGEQAGDLGASLIHHARLTDEEIALFDSNLATWLPRIVYALVLAWLAASLLRQPNPFIPELG